MTFYRLINNKKKVIGISTSNNFVKSIKNCSIITPATENDVQYIICNNQIYRDLWMRPITNFNVHYELAEIIEITEQEYNDLEAALDLNEEIEINYPDEQEEISSDPEPTEPSFTLEYVKETKIKSLSHICNKMIESGVSVELSDGTSHHFSLTTQDQLNLITLSTMINENVPTVPYHADGELCIFFSAQDMQTIIAAATNHKIYHTTYFNAAKNYINHLEDTETILAFNYGDTLPEEYQTDVLKSLNHD